MDKEEWKKCFDYQTQKELKNLHDRNQYYERVNEKMKRNINNFQKGTNKSDAIQYADGQRLNQYSGGGYPAPNSRALRQHELAQSNANGMYANDQ